MSDLGTPTTRYGGSEAQISDVYKKPKKPETAFEASKHSPKLIDTENPGWFLSALKDFIDTVSRPGLPSVPVNTMTQQAASGDLPRPPAKTQAPTKPSLEKATPSQMPTGKYSVTAPPSDDYGQGITDGFEGMSSIPLQRSFGPEAQLQASGEKPSAPSPIPVEKNLDLLKPRDQKINPFEQVGYMLANAIYPQGNFAGLLAQRRAELERSNSEAHNDYQREIEARAAEERQIAAEARKLEAQKGLVTWQQDVEQKSPMYQAQVDALKMNAPLKFLDTISDINYKNDLGHSAEMRGTVTPRDLFSHAGNLLNNPMMMMDPRAAALKDYFLSQYPGMGQQQPQQGIADQIISAAQQMPDKSMAAQKLRDFIQKRKSTLTMEESSKLNAAVAALTGAK